MAKVYYSSYEAKTQRENSIIIVDGVKYTYAEYQKMKRAKKKEEERKCRKQREQTLIQMLPEYIRKMVKHVKVLKSLAAFYDNGYRQWGVICREILNHPLIVGDYAHFRVLSREMEQLLSDIDKFGKKNEKNVFQFVERLSYKIDDIKETMDKLTVNVYKSRVCEFFKDKECINGNGRRLGLAVIMTKSLLATSEIEALISELKKIADGGVDAFEYDHDNGHYIGVRF